MKKNTLFLSLNLCLLGSLEVSASRTPQPSIIEDPEVAQKKCEIASHLELITAAVCADDAEVPLAFFKEHYPDVDLAFSYGSVRDYYPELLRPSIPVRSQDESRASFPKRDSSVIFWPGSRNLEVHFDQMNITSDDKRKVDTFTKEGYNFSPDVYFEYNGILIVRRNLWELLDNFYGHLDFETTATGTFRMKLPVVFSDLRTKEEQSSSHVLYTLDFKSLIEQIYHSPQDPKKPYALKGCQTLITK